MSWSHYPKWFNIDNKIVDHRP
ncbi:tryptophanase leader peptide [Escherichia coli]|nr:tryptophanase leader peptide [Escherichia coli]